MCACVQTNIKRRERYPLTSNHNKQKYQKHDVTTSEEVHKKKITDQCQIVSAIQKYIYNKVILFLFSSIWHGVDTECIE